MRDFNGKTLLGQILFRLKKKSNNALIVIATSTFEQDNIIEDFCRENSVECFRGSEQNVLERYFMCAQKYQFDNIVRMTADNPFPDIEELDNLIDFHEKNGYDFSECLTQLPIGVGMEIFTYACLEDDMKNYQNALADMNNEAVEYVRGVPVVKTFGQTVHTFKRFKGSIDSYYKFCIAYCKKCRMPMLFYTVCINSAFAFLITLALILTGGGAVTRSILLSLIFYVIFTPVIATSMSKVLFMSENGMVVNDALTRIHSILDMQPLSEPQNAEHPMNPSVEFKNVSFRYSGAQTDAIHNISFQVQPGETVAFVGPSGGGKTTAAELISRSFDVNSGEIKVGGVNVKNIRKSELMETVSYVFQDGRLLKTSVFENVRLAKPNASRQEVENALHRAQCDDILAKLPDGMDTVIGTKGVYLSGGEQQRIAIARVILKDSPIIILDEATAFADPENESLVQRAFEDLSKDKTVIMIAHRLSTVRNADRIYVLKDGRVAEYGTHEALAEKKGLYAKMWKDYQTSVRWKVGGAG